MGAKEDMIEEVYEVEPFHINTIWRILRTVEAKGWLRDPDQVTGRTMTESEMERNCALYGSAYETGFRQAGGLIVPDPEPTNADALVGDLLDCHVAFSERELDAIAGHLVERGWTKAPGGDDE